MSAAVDEHGQLDDPEDADAEDLAHQQVARPDGREDDLDDPALLLLDDAGQDREPEAEDADEDQDGPDVGDEEARLVVLGLRLDRGHRRRLLGGRERRLVDIARTEHRLDAQRGRRAGDELGDALVGLLLEADRPRAGQVGRHLDDDLDRLVGQGRVSRGGRRVRRDRDLPVELGGRRFDRRHEARRRRLDDADFVASSSPNRMAGRTNEPMTMSRREERR